MVWKRASLLIATTCITLGLMVAPVAAQEVPQDYDIAIGRYQLLTQLNANANNDPLKKAAVTLSRTDLISFE